MLSPWVQIGLGYSAPRFRISVVFRPTDLGQAWSLGHSWVISFGIHWTHLSDIAAKTQGGWRLTHTSSKTCESSQLRRFELLLTWCYRAVWRTWRKALSALFHIAWVHRCPWLASVAMIDRGKRKSAVHPREPGQFCSHSSRSWIAVVLLGR